MNGRISWFDLHYLVGTAEGTEHFVEHHELGLFTMGEMRQILENAGLVVTYEEEGIIRARVMDWGESCLNLMKEPSHNITVPTVPPRGPEHLKNKRLSNF